MLLGHTFLTVFTFPIWGCTVVLALGLVACTRPVVVRDPKAPVEEWPAYGNDPGSSRYSPLSEITKDNVGGAQGGVDVSHRRRVGRDGHLERAKGVGQEHV